MNWKDTVMTEEELEIYWRNPDECDDVGIAESQAEITWDIAYKAGYEEREKGLSPDETKRLEEALIAGRSDVVEWIKNNCFTGTANADDTGEMLMTILEREWKPQLNEWGIDG